MVTLDALIRYSIGIIRCSKKKRPDELNINDILHKEWNLTEVKLTDI